jgi:hypothetical protein
MLRVIPITLMRLKGTPPRRTKPRATATTDLRIPTDREEAIGDMDRVS